MIVLKLEILLAVCSMSVLAVPAETGTQDYELVDGLSKFTSDFYQECMQSQPEPENLIISPYSVAVSLAFLAQATDGVAFNELRKMFDWKSDKETIANQFHRLSKSVERSAGESEMIIANKIYVSQEFQLKKEFQDIAQKMFSSDVESVDFIKNNDTALSINNYVAAKTKGKIQEIVTPDMFDSDTVSYLVNAIYLKSRWLQRFWTHFMKQKFYISETEAVEIYFMETQYEFWIATVEELDAVALRMDYVNSSLSFIIILPNNRTGLSSLETQFGKIKLSEIANRMKLQTCKIFIPKFKVESKFELKDILKKMGVSAIFDPDQAALSGLLNTSTAKSRPFYVDKIIHKTIIEINEEFTEVAGVTGIKARYQIGITTSLRVDHPFMYHIWDRDSKTSIFSGRIVRPTLNGQ